MWKKNIDDWFKGNMDIGVSKDCQTVATSGKTVLLWTLKRDEHVGDGAFMFQRGQLHGHRGCVNSLVFLDADKLITGSEDLTARI